MHANGNVSRPRCSRDRCSARPLWRPAIRHCRWPCAAWFRPEPGPRPGRSPISLRWFVPFRLSMNPLTGPGAVAPHVLDRGEDTAPDPSTFGVAASRRSSARWAASRAASLPKRFSMTLAERQISISEIMDAPPSGFSRHAPDPVEAEPAGGAPALGPWRGLGPEGLVEPVGPSD